MAGLVETVRLGKLDHRLVLIKVAQNPVQQCTDGGEMLYKISSLYT